MRIPRTHIAFGRNDRNSSTWFYWHDHAEVCILFYVVCEYMIFLSNLLPLMQWIIFLAESSEAISSIPQNEAKTTSTSKDGWKLRKSKHYIHVSANRSCSHYNGSILCRLKKLSGVEWIPIRYVTLWKLYICSEQRYTFSQIAMFARWWWGCINLPGLTRQTSVKSGDFAELFLRY